MKVELNKSELSWLKMCKKNFNHYLVNYSIGKLLGYMVSTCISQRKLCKLIDSTSTGHVSNIIAGRKNLTLLNAISLAEVLGLNNTQKVELYESLPRQKVGK